MDTRDEDQETGAPPAGLPSGHGAAGAAAPRQAGRALALAGRALALAGLPLTGRAAAGPALLAAALLAAGVLRFGWSALFPRTATWRWSASRWRGSTRGPAGFLTG